MQTASTPSHAARITPGAAPSSTARTRFGTIDLGQRFDRMFVAVAAWPVIGLFLDAWAHYQQQIETFFTPWHAALYSGFLATAGYLVWTVVPTRQRALGYDLSLTGAWLFMAAGVGDLVWHTLFGVERNEQALFSPTHLLIATAGILLVTGPLRASWYRTDGGKLGERIPWPALLSLSFVLFTLALFLEYSNPFNDPQLLAGDAPASDWLAFHTQMHGVLGVLVHAALITGMVLFAMRRWSLPLGSLTLLLATSGTLVAIIRDRQALIPIAWLAGVVADALLRLVGPSPTRPSGLRLFAFLMPATYYAIYLIALAFSRGIWWSIHVSTGTVALAGVVGLLLSFLAVPPTLPSDL
jgi:hypothetical protein